MNRKLNNQKTVKGRPLDPHVELPNLPGFIQTTGYLTPDNVLKANRLTRRAFASKKAHCNVRPA